LRHDKRVEVSEVALSDTVVDPWAMVIESVDTSLAQGAVPTARRSDHLTIWAQATRLVRVQ